MNHQVKIRTLSKKTLFDENIRHDIANHSTTDHKEGEKLEDRRSVDASSCGDSGDGTDQRVQSLMFMMMMMKILHIEA